MILINTGDASCGTDVRNGGRENFHFTCIQGQGIPQGFAHVASSVVFRPFKTHQRCYLSVLKIYVISPPLKQRGMLKQCVIDVKIILFFIESLTDHGTTVYMNVPVVLTLSL